MLSIVGSSMYGRELEDISCSFNLTCYNPKEEIKQCNMMGECSYQESWNDNINLSNQTFL